MVIEWFVNMWLIEVQDDEGFEIFLQLLESFAVGGNIMGEVGSKGLQLQLQQVCRMRQIRRPTASTFPEVYS